MSRAAVTHRRERLDRGIKVRSDDIFAIASLRDLAWLVVPRLLMILALLAFPLLEAVVSGYWQTVILHTLVIALLALSWDLLASAGLVSLGQSLFVGAGGYVAGYLNARHGTRPALDAPCRDRRRGGAFHRPALPAAAAARNLLRHDHLRAAAPAHARGGDHRIPRRYGGDLRSHAAARAHDRALSRDGGRPRHLYAYRRLASSDYGLVFHAIRDNDRAVMAAGYDIQWCKAQAVFLAALPATFAGAFVTHHYQFVGMPAFAMEYSTCRSPARWSAGPGASSGRWWAASSWFRSPR